MLDAVNELLDRRSRYSYPKGHRWDGGIEWGFKITERAECCPEENTIDHCCTIEHMANLYEVDPSELSSALHVYCTGHE
jgi:hypothetical protein